MQPLQTFYPFCRALLSSLLANQNKHMKTKVAQIEKPEVKEATVIKVPADVKAAIIACFKTDEKAASIAKEQQQTWLLGGETLAKHYDTKDEARPVLKQVFTDAGHDVKDIKWSSYISKILTLGFPENEKAIANLAKAKEAGLPTNSLVAVARGTMKPGAKGEWIKVEGKTKQGGSNKKSPLVTFETALASAFTAANIAKLPEAGVANAILDSLKDTKYDAQDLIDELESQLAKRKED